MVTARLTERPCSACASLLAALDVHHRIAMRILRHSKIAITMGVTMEIYTEVVSSATREALRKLGDQLGPLRRLLHFAAVQA
jgi:hypothetical protein